jgi:MFS family permease
MPSPATEPAEATSLLRQRPFVLFWIGRLFSSLGLQAQAVTIAWQVYNVSRDAHQDIRHAAFAVGMIGLAQFLPVVALTLPAGALADRHDRRRIAAVCLSINAATAAGLALLALFDRHAIWPIYLAAMVFGSARTFLGPANTAMAPMLAPRSLLPRAIASSSLANQSATIIGPALGGILCAISPAVAFGAACACYLVSASCLLLIRAGTRPKAQDGSRWALVKEGLTYVWENKVVFGAISLDLFAVLLGGATALLPVFARDILHIGPQGFGILRSSPAIGAASVAVLLAARPIRRRAGLVMFCGVAVFGAATVAFALSRWVAVSVAALAVLGGADMLSVFVRQTLVQLVTPDPMRGRVAAVSGLFIGASNELGEFESGVAARLLGAVGATLFGGIGALIVTGLWAKLFPALRQADRLG